MDYLIVGNGDYSRMLARYLRHTKGIEVTAFTVQKSAIHSKALDGKSVIPTEEVIELYKPIDTRLFMGIGYRNMNQIKQRAFIEYKNRGYVFENYIHPTAVVDERTIMGEGNNIFEAVIIQEGVCIGDVNLIYGGAMIAHECIIGDFNSVSIKACVAGCTHIGNNCFVGANATLRDHICISDFTLVGAGAYVDNNTNPYDVIAPQKSIVVDGKKSLEFI